VTNLFGISGYSRTGKDTFAAALVEGRGFQQRSFAEPLRQMLLAQDPFVRGEIRLSVLIKLIGWEEAKDFYPEVRRLLQALGTEAGRKILGESIWVDTAMREVDDQLNRFENEWMTFEAPHFVFSDVRFHNEAEAIKARGGIIIRLERDGVTALNGHATETAMDDWSFDYVVQNNGTVSDLRQRAFDIVEKEAGRFTADAYHELAAVPPPTPDAPYANDSFSGWRLENGRTVTPSGTTMFTVDL
jgi:hypothetical protein